MPLQNSVNILVNPILNPAINDPPGDIMQPVLMTPEEVSATSSDCQISANNATCSPHQTRLTIN
jgi:hypothetical protein